MNGLMLVALVAATVAGWAIFLGAAVVADAMRMSDGKWLAGAGWICTSVAGLMLGVQPHVWITEANWPIAVLPVSLAMVVWQNLHALRCREGKPCSKQRKAAPFVMAAVLGVLVLIAPPTRAAEPVKVVTGSNDVGAWTVLFRDDGYTIVPQTYALRWEAVTPALRDDIAALPNSTDWAATIEALARKHATTHISDQALFDVYGPDAAKIAAAHPLPPVWRVAKLGASVDRPAYPFTEDGRGTYSTARVPVGTLCDAWTRFVEGDSVYARVADGLVALCKREP